MMSERKSPAPAATGCEASNEPLLNSHCIRCPTLPTNGEHATHCRAVLQCLLSGEKIDQFLYHARTGLPLVDYRTRVSNLRLNNHWPICDEFHLTRDFNGEVRRVKWYWLDSDKMELLFHEYPGFQQRCAALTFEFGGEVEE